MLTIKADLSRLFERETSVVFKIQEKGRPETAIWLKEDPVTIANDGNGDLHFDATAPDTARVRIILENDKPYLADMTFNQPIFINDQVIPPGSRRVLKHGDQIQIGNSQFEISNPKSVVQKLQVGNADNARDENHWRLKATGNWLDGQVFVLKGKTVIGRDTSCTITIPGSHLSRRHVEFLAVGPKLLMKDLDSSNGSFVNGKRCQEAQLNEGDEVKLDVLTFRVLAPESIAGSDKSKSGANDPVDITREGDKNWVTKPTSIGNAGYDPHDALLAKHLRSKKITYAIFGGLFFILAIAAFIIL